ncbi:fungal-specific transcription factor domain-containing protein, partial [Tirmania nivea]
MSQWSGLRPGSSGGSVRSRSASTSSLSTPMVSGQAPKKKVVTACQRCRTRKIKCDGVLPCCGNCTKAGQPCMEVDKSGERDIPRSHVLELENRIKYLENLLVQNCPNIDLDTNGPHVELRSRPAPPAIRVVTSGPSLHPQFNSSINTSPPISAVSTPASFEFSLEPSGSGLRPPYSPAFSPFSFSEPPGSGMPSPMLSPSSPLLGHDYGSAGSVFGNPIAQDVGLVTLGLTEDSSRYIGASSGYEFARVTFADWPASEPPGPSAAVGDNPERKRGRWAGVKKSSPLPSLEDGNRFASAFFDSVHPHYPFLERNTFEACREVVYSSEKGVTATFTALKRAPSIPILPPNFTLPLARFHVFMVFAVGSIVLSAEKGQRPTADSDGYVVSAMAHVEHDEVNLRGSLQGLQNLLLIAMYALHVDSGGGMSIWHLNSTLVAGCIELGLHKNAVVTMAGSGKVGPAGTDSALVALRRRIFWSIYALDRNLGIMLGRPFALDENECDVELPENLLDDRPGSGLVDRLSVQGGHSPGGLQGGESADVLIGTSSFPGTVYLLQMTRITSVIKSTLYRI